MQPVSVRQAHRCGTAFNHGPLGRARRRRILNDPAVVFCRRGSGRAPCPHRLRRSRTRPRLVAQPGEHRVGGGFRPGGRARHAGAARCATPPGAAQPDPADGVGA